MTLEKDRDAVRKEVSWKKWFKFSYDIWKKWISSENWHERKEKKKCMCCKLTVLTLEEVGFQAGLITCLIPKL